MIAALPRASSCVQAEKKRVSYDLRDKTCEHGNVNNPDTEKDKTCNWLQRWTMEEICQLQANDKSVQNILKWKSEGLDVPRKEIISPEGEETKRLCSQWSSLEVKDGILYRRCEAESTHRKRHFSKLLYHWP